MLVVGSAYKEIQIAGLGRLASRALVEQTQGSEFNTLNPYNKLDVVVKEEEEVVVHT